MTDKKPFDKEHGVKISFSELVELIGTSCDYKFCIIDENIDDELLELAAKHNIDLNGYKHVIETSGIQHSEKRHGNKSEDRTPLSLEDYLLIPFIIRNRDEVSISPSKTGTNNQNVLLYKKKVGLQYVYVEEIRDGKHKSLAFKSFRKRKTESPSDERGKSVLSQREHAEARPLRLDNALVFHSVSATNCLQNYNKN